MWQGCRKSNMNQTVPKHCCREIGTENISFTTEQSIFVEGLRICRGKMLRHLAKSLCRGPDSRQRVFAEGPDPRQRQAHSNNNYLSRAKPSAKGRPSVTPSDTTSIPCRQSLPRASPLGPRQRLFNRFWNFAFKKFFAECPWTSTRQRQSLPSAKLALGKFSIFFFFFFTPNFLLGPPTLFTTSCSNLVLFLLFLLYLVD